MNCALPVGPIVLAVATDHWPIRGWRFGVVLGGDNESASIHVAAMAWEFTFEVLRRNP